MSPFLKPLFLPRGQRIGEGSPRRYRRGYTRAAFPEVVQLKDLLTPPIQLQIHSHTRSYYARDFLARKGGKRKSRGCNLKCSFYAFWLFHPFHLLCYIYLFFLLLLLLLHVIGFQSEKAQTEDTVLKLLQTALL